MLCLPLIHHHRLSSGGGGLNIVCCPLPMRMDMLCCCVERGEGDQRYEEEMNTTSLGTSSVPSPICIEPICQSNQGNLVILDNDRWLNTAMSDEGYLHQIHELYGLQRQNRYMSKCRRTILNTTNLSDFSAAREAARVRRARSGGSAEAGAIQGRRHPRTQVHRHWR